MRTLSSELDFIQHSATSRQPAWQVLLYDIRSTTDTINSVVRFNIGATDVIQGLTGPYDFTEHVVSVKIDEQRSDYINSGIVATQIDVTLADPTGILDPALLFGFTTADPEYQYILGRFLRRGNVVVVRVGDSRVDSADWTSVFTGRITGQAGKVRGRTNGGESTLSFRALSREADFVKYVRTSSPYTLGETYLSVAQSIAELDMGLDADEYSLTGWGTTLIAHRSVQFVEETPLSMIAKLMFPDFIVPRFTGEGVLTQYGTAVTGLPVRVYQDYDIFTKFDRPFNELEQPNAITIVGLDAELSKIAQPDQPLARLSLTTGFFTDDEDINVYWSDDRTTIAENPVAKILKSAGISWLGGGETFDDIPTPGGSFDGTIGMRVTISTGYAPWVVVVLLVSSIAASWIPDVVITAGFGIGAGETIPVGRFAQQTLLSSALYVMTQIGRVEIEFHGTPIEYVYKELRSKAVLNGTSAFEENEEVVENHLITTQAKCDAVARETLFLLQSQGNARDVEMLLDLALEPGDIFEVESTQRFMVDKVSYTLVRDADQAIRVQMECFEVTSGVLA